MDGVNHEGVARAIIWMVLVCWPVGILLAWYWRKRWLRRYEELGESTSEEMLAELKKAYATRQQVIFRTSTEYLPFIFEAIREVVQAGFDDKHMLSLLERVQTHPPDDERQAVFPVEVRGKTVDLHFRWVRDKSDRIRLTVTAAPDIIRALRKQKKHIPKAATVD